jgi:hypothetical protein
MAEIGERLALGAEPIDEVRRGELRTKELDRDPLLERLVGAMPEVDDAHATPSEQAFQAVGPDAAPDEARADVVVEGPLMHRKRRGDEVPRLRLGAEERTKLLDECRIRPAEGREIALWIRFHEKARARGRATPWPSRRRA